MFVSVNHQQGSRTMESLLTVDDLRVLPCRALAALLARCARRVQPLAARVSSEGPADCATSKVVETAMAQMIGAVENFAKGECFAEPSPLGAGKVTGMPTVAAFQSGSLALRAVRAASICDDDACQLAVTSIGWALDAAVRWASGSDARLRSALARDFAFLRQAALDGEWID